MPIADRIRLSLMMFLNYVIWGSWYVTLGAYLTINLKFTGTQAGAVFRHHRGGLHDLSVFCGSDR